MKNKIIIVLLLVVCISLTGCSNKLSEEEIKEMLEVTNEERTFIVNKVTYATDKITIKEIAMQVKDNIITLGDYNSHSNSKSYKQITGYYDQVSATYYIYILEEDANGKTSILEMRKNDADPFDSVGWVNKLISNASDLILIDCTEIDEMIGQIPTRYQVYALVDNELVLID